MEKLSKRGFYMIWKEFQSW